MKDAIKIPAEIQNAIGTRNENEKAQLPPRYVAAPQLLEILFDENCRPSLRWVRDQQRNRTIPFVRIGRLCFFDPQLVKATLDAKAAGRKGMQ